jgi:hypothetical protein
MSTNEIETIGEINVSYVVTTHEHMLYSGVLAKDWKIISGTSDFTIIIEDNKETVTYKREEKFIGSPTTFDEMKLHLQNYFQNLLERRILVKLGISCCIQK